MWECENTLPVFNTIDAQSAGEVNKSPRHARIHHTHSHTIAFVRRTRTSIQNAKKGDPFFFFFAGTQKQEERENLAPRMRRKPFLLSSLSLSLSSFPRHNEPRFAANWRRRRSECGWLGKEKNTEPRARGKEIGTADVPCTVLKWPIHAVYSLVYLHTQLWTWHQVRTHSQLKKMTECCGKNNSASSDPPERVSNNHRRRN